MSTTGVQSNVSIRPGVGMLGLLASMSYKPWYALSEFVDNALASWLANADALRAVGTEQLEVSIEFDSGLGEIVIRDNAAGIAGHDVDRAFKSAEPPPDVSGLSQFGIGMKAAACWYARRFTVTSSALGEHVSRRIAFDVPAIVAANQEELPVSVESAPVEQHGTTIVLSDLHRPIPQGQTLGKIRRYLASIYRGFLGRELTLMVKGDAVRFDEPAILERPRWDRSPDGPSIRWRKDVEIRLTDGRIVPGWAALRERGSTKEAGLALLFRRKVVVGSGAGAGESEDLYRPIEIFGGGNSFVSQRLFGELDVSALRVTYSKDAIIWDGYEEEFLAELRRQLDSEPLPLLKMGNKYRVNERGPGIRDQVRAAVSATAAAAAATEFPEVAPDEDDAPALDADPTGRAEGGTAPASARSVGDVVETPFQVRVGATELKLWLSVSDAVDVAWLRVTNTGDAYRISVTRDHPFMRSFAHLPNQEIEPVLRLAVALGVAEVAARLSGLRGAGQVRQQLNAALRGALGTTTLPALADSAEDVP